MGREEDKKKTRERKKEKERGSWVKNLRERIKECGFKLGSLDFLKEEGDLTFKRVQNHSISSEGSVRSL